MENAYFTDRGNPEWCDRWRMQMISSVKNVFACETSDGWHIPPDIERILDMLSTGKEYIAWVNLNKKDGSFFGTLESFCEYEQPWGLGIRPYARFREALVHAKGEPFVSKLEAGIITEAKGVDMTFQVTDETTPQEFAQMLIDNLDHDFVVALAQALAALTA